MQTVDEAVWKLFNEAEKVEQKRAENKINNTKRKTAGGWVDKIVSKIRISDLADEFDVDKCPDCGYSLDFDDGNGFFICINKKYNSKCDFGGNIVDFQMRCGR